uniref:Uncharacterized protein n=1 Tax=uncultured prokaryote TaxID=198431 RepID=A0A0H5Q7J1_9ZZZZ|nr:hypothetical protein [uncultured prokaryote]
MALITRVRTIWTGVAGSPAYTNLYSIQGSLDTVTLHTATANFFNGIRDQVSTGTVMTTEGDVALIDSVTGEIVGVESVPEIANTGAGSGGRVPGADNILLRWFTGDYIGGRQIRGRTYLPYMRSGAITASGQVLGTSATAIENSASAYRIALGGSAVVYSPKNGVGVQITSSSVWNEWAVMRSRRD